MNVIITPQAVSVSIRASGAGIDIGEQIARDYVDCDPYTGDYTITPGTAEQVLETRNMRMTDNLTVNPIPSNYGLITWNGAVLTVS